MKKGNAIILLFAIVIFTGCVTPSYYLSPLHTNSNYYHTIPLKSDSVKSATYVSAALLGGGSNYQWRDGGYGFQGNIYHSHSFGNFQAYYGADITLGNYAVKQFTIYRYAYYSPYDSSINIPHSNNFFGAYGFNGGINCVFPFKKRGEGRLGIETSFNKEFGNYLSFRKSLPDSAIDVLEKSNSTNLLGIYFDFNWKTRKDTQIGYKIAAGGSFVSGATYLGFNNYNSPLYFSQTVHVTHQQFTWFLQASIGSYSGNIKLGTNYNVGSKK